MDISRRYTSHFLNSKSVNAANSSSYTINWCRKSQPLLLLSALPQLYSPSRGIGHKSRVLLTVMAFCPDPEGWGPISPVYYNFTLCFAESVFPLILGLGLLILSPRDFRALSQYPVVFVQVTFWLYAKVALIAFVALLQLIFVTALRSLSETWVDLRIFAALVYFVSVLISGYIQYTEHFRARVDSGIVLFYWFLSALTGFARLYGLIQRHAWQDSEAIFLVQVFSFVATVALLLGKFFINPLI